MASTEVTDYYEVLGVASNATLKDINNAYKRLALKHHPDKSGGGDVDEFQRIQEAAENLRDPYRRRKHDCDLRVSRVRNYYRQAGQASGGNSLNQQFPQPAFYSRWMPSSVGSQSMGSGGYRYMYSYWNSVHMNPHSKESVEERERCAHERKLDEELRRRAFYQAGEEYEPPAHEQKTKQETTESFEGKSWEVRRREAMRARVLRDEEELKNEVEEDEDAGDRDGGKAAQGVMSEGSEDEGETSEEENEEEQDSQSDPMSSAAEDGDYDGKDGGNGNEGNDENEDELSLASSVEQSVSEYGTAQEESEVSDSDNEDESDEVAHQEHTVFYDCTDAKSSHLSNTTETISSEKTSESEAGDNDSWEEDEEPNFDSNNNGLPTSLISPFIPHFMTKFNDPSGNYTEEDLQVELYGIMMEAYCVWLEDIRLTFSDAMPASTTHSNDPGVCLHLGYWEKTFECPECEGCHRWRPVFALTCPGCGVKRCVGCKFAGERRG